MACLDVLYFIIWQVAQKEIPPIQTQSPQLQQLWQVQTWVTSSRIHCFSFSLVTLVQQELHEISLIWASKISCQQEQTHQSDVTSYVPVTQSVFPWSVPETHKGLWSLSEFTLTAYYFCNFALTSLVLSAADERSRQTGWEAANILKLGEKRSFHQETCRRINLPSSKCPVFNLLPSLLLVLTSFFPYSWINTSNFSSTLKWPPRAVGKALIKL